MRRIMADKQECKVQLAASIARFFGVPLDWLADDSQDWPPPASEDTQILQTVRAALAQHGGDVTAHERELLVHYRNLSPEHRGRVFGLAVGLDVSGGDVAAAEIAAQAFEEIERLQVDERGERRPAPPRRGEKAG